MTASSPHETLEQFFRSCPPEILLSYRKKYLDEEGAAPPPEAIAADVAAVFGDRRRVRAILKDLSSAHHLALIALIQTGGVAGGTWLLQELVQAHGKREDTWADVLHDLGRRLLLFGNSHQAPPLFYVLPRPLLDAFAAHFTKRLRMPSVPPDGVRLSKDTNYNFPVGYSLVSLLTYLAANHVRVTQKSEIFKKHLEEAQEYFGNLWGRSDADKVMRWNLDQLRTLGLLTTRQGCLVPDDGPVREWLALAPRERRDLMLAAFHEQEPLLPWLLHGLDAVPEDQWVPIDALGVMYRRRSMGDVFHRRFVQKTYYLPPSGFYDLSPPLEFTQIAGLTERGLHPDGPVVRLSRTGRAFLAGEPLGETGADEPVPFLLQPNFEILAPAGMPLPDLYTLGQMCRFESCDRMNRYLLTQETVLAAMDGGMRRSEVLRFLRNGAAHGVPQNVDSTVDEWIGDHGEIEFHDALVVTIRTEKEEVLVQALQSCGIAHKRMADGVYAMPREDRDVLVERLHEAGLAPTPWVRHYGNPGGGHSVVAELLAKVADPADQEALLTDGRPPLDFPSRQLVVLQLPDAEAATADDSLEMFMAVNGDGHRIASLGSDLGRKPGAAGSGDLLKLSPVKTLDLIRAAINRGHDIEILYRQSGDGGGMALTRVTPRKAHADGGVSSFDGYDHHREVEATWTVKRIQGIRLVR